jgi:hypothetical protein
LRWVGGSVFDEIITTASTSTLISKEKEKKEKNGKQEVVTIY